MIERRFAKPTSGCSRPSGLRRIGVAAAGLAAVLILLPGASHAAVEFVTGVGDCAKLDTQSDNQRLSVLAGENRVFEVWGDGIDIGRAVRVTSVGNPADDLVQARIVRPHNGAENLLRGCRIAKGSVEVRVDSPAEAGATRIRTLHFRMPAGDESSLAVRVGTHPVPVWTFTKVAQTPSGCLTKNVGTVVQDLNNSRLVITLPPGAASDTSNCTLRIETQVTPAERPQFDVWGAFNYTLQVPALLSLASGSSTAGTASFFKQINFDGNAALIRRISATSTSTVRIATPNPNRADTLTLVVNAPPAANAFTQACICRNQTTGTTINANDDFQCEIRLSQQPPAGGQPISFEAQDRQCVIAGASSVSYSSASGLGSYTAPATGTFHQVALRAGNGSTSAGTPCASRTSPVSHTLKFWVGARGAESGPGFTQCQIAIRSPS